MYNILTVGQLKQILADCDDNQVFSVDTSAGSFLLLDRVELDWSGPTFYGLNHVEIAQPSDEPEDESDWQEDDYGQPDNWYD